MEKESTRSEGNGGFTFFSFVWRFLVALVLVLLTYNPSDYSLFAWIDAAITNDNIGSAHLFVGVLFMIGWTIFLGATYRSLGPVGLVLGAAFFGTLIWMLTDFGILSASSLSTITWIALICLSGLLAIGLSWSHVWRRMTGQLVVDNIDES